MIVLLKIIDYNYGYAQINLSSSNIKRKKKII